MFNTLLSLDTELLIQARGLVSPEYAPIVQILGESIVIWCMLVLLGLWFTGVYYKDTSIKTNAIRICLTVIGVFIIYAIINFCTPQWRPSPQTVVGGITPLIPHPLDNSFPSGHALFSGALLIGLWKYFPSRLLISLTSIIALLTVSARVIGGVHYPGDILAGLILGGVTALFLKKIITSSFMEIRLYSNIIKAMSWIKL